jgi:mono/diheme cytochrome c family protein
VTEVPEHLLRRAKERRAALTGGAAPEAAPATSPAPSAAVEPADAAAPAPVAPAEAAPAVPEVAPPSPMVAVEAAARRTSVPLWVMPVLVFLPFWGFLYTGAFGAHAKPRVVDPLVLGQQTYAGAGCSSCHGAHGEGGVGPALTGGQAKLTFPNEADHISWVKTGSAPFKGKLYGDPNRTGGQHGPATGGMPAFGGTLSDRQIEAVVAYEREKL